MSTPEPQSSAFARTARVLFDRKDPWRREFLALRMVARAGFAAPLVSRLDERFRSRFRERPASVFPYLRYAAQKHGVTQAVALGTGFAESPTVTAAVLVEIAKYYYSCGRFALGDSLIERAKLEAPDLPRIYDEEAWNQRARGNLHRELQAVRRSVELADDPKERLRWEMWLGETYLRLGEPYSAWETLQRFTELPSETPSIYSAAYCAVTIGDAQAAARAYRLAAPSPSGGIDYLTAAREQLVTFGRATEVLRLLKEGAVQDETEALELAYRAYLRTADISAAMEALTRAVDREDRSAWVTSTLAQFQQLIGEPRAALETYGQLTESERGAALDLLHAQLLVEVEGSEAAVRVMLGEPQIFPETLTFKTGPEVDPQVPELMRRASGKVDTPSRQAALRDLLPRLSNPSAIAETARALGHSLAAEGRWDEAWDAVRQSHGQRLPAISLGLLHRSLIGLTWEMQYAEWAATEPIASDTVLYESSLGESTGCNPLAICLELLRDPERDHLTHVWSVTSRATIAPELLAHPRVRFVRKGSIGHMRYLATAGYLINNATWEHCFSRRPGQHALNTWHGVPWKTLGRDLRTDSFAYGNVARSMLQADLILVPDSHTLDVLTRGMAIEDLVSPSTLMLSGYPRNDLAINLSAAQREQLRTRIGLSTSDKLVVFMPTWKGLFEERNAEVEETLAAAQEMSGAGYVVAVRAHQKHREELAGGAPPPRGRVITPDIDTKELVGAADVLVTDFSSVLFDAAAVGVPVVTLTAAIEEYQAERGLYFPPEEVPGQSAPTAADAARRIREAIANPAEYTARYAAQTQRFSAGEHGTSAARAIRAFFDGERDPQPARQHPRPLLLATGGLPPNGITRAARSLLWALDGSDYRPHLPLNANGLDTATPETISDVRQYANVVPWVGRPAGTRMEREVLRFFASREFRRSTLIDPFLKSGRLSEARRLYGETEFAAVVEYGAYDSQSIALMALGVRLGEGRRGVILHSEMWKEVTTRYPKLRSGMSLLGEFDFIASVSDGARASNTEDLFEQYGVPPEKHITLENTINTAEILAGSAAPLDGADQEWYARPGVHACIVGRLSPEKNHQAFLEALARIAPTLERPFFLTLLGDGPLMLELQRSVAELGLQGHVRLRGLVANPYAHIRAADALLLPSLHEGQPLVILESLTIGTPVIATDIPGSRSVLREGELGRLVPLTDEGLEDAIRIVASGDLVPADAFDPDQFTENSRNRFLAVIDGQATEVAG